MCYPLCLYCGLISSKLILGLSQLLKITEEKKKKLSNTRSSGLAYSIPVVAPNLVIEEGGSNTPAFWTWGLRAPPYPILVVSHLYYNVFPFLHLTCSTLLLLPVVWWTTLSLVCRNITRICSLCVFHLLLETFYRSSLFPSPLNGIGLPIIFWAGFLLLYFWICM